MFEMRLSHFGILLIFLLNHDGFGWPNWSDGKNNNKMACEVMQPCKIMTNASAMNVTFPYIIDIPRRVFNPGEEIKGISNN